MYREAEEEEDSDEDLERKAYELETAASTTVAATETTLGEDEEKNENDDDEEEEKFETRWRCWKCKKIFRMDEQCPTHLVNLGDYEDYDFDTLLVEVKVNK